MAIGLHKYSVQEALAPYYNSETVINLTGDTFAAVDSNPDKITSTGHNFISLGFKAGDKITISGAGDAANHGVHEVASVAAGNLTFTSASSLTVDLAGDDWVVKKNMSPSRAIINETSSTLNNVTLTFEDGSTLKMSLAVGVVYPMTCTDCDSNSVSFLY